MFRSALRAAKRGLRHNAVTGTIYALASLRFGRDSYLREKGWWESFRERGAVDGDWQPLPWYTYPAIDFLKARAQSDWSVFEYGAGNSTLWWARHVGEVVSCEHDKAWHDKVAAGRADNMTLLYRAAGEGGYAKVLDEYPGRFDVVVIDGMERTLCANHAAAALKASGVIVWDNSDQDAEYGSGMRHLVQQGFKRLDFWGPGPGAVRGWSTSIFYRADNCLGI